MEKSAIISECGNYRYELTRKWSDTGTCVFVGLNPSTADADLDDPTIRRCIGFAKNWGYGKLVMLNAYAYRSTDPKALKTAPYPIGRENNKFLMQWSTKANIIIAAWGTNINIMRQHRCMELLGNNVYHLGLTKNNFPKHPLYLSKNTKPNPWK